MLTMQRIEIFVAVRETGSFTQAAKTLGLSKAVVSFNIKKLEEKLGVSLLTRTTRKVMATEAGETFYLRCKQLLHDAEAILDDVRGEHSELNGLLRITTTPEYGAKVIVPLLADFAGRHPQLRIQHVASSKNDDLISGRYDLAIRLGQLVDSTHHAKLIDRFTILPVASTHYLTTYHSMPITQLEQLQNARWIAHSGLEKPLRWQVITPTGESALFNVNTPPTIMADSISSLLAFVRCGVGVALLPSWLVQDDIVVGNLIPLLPNYRFPRQGIYAVYPNTRHVPEKVRAFIDFLQAHIDESSSILPNSIVPAAS